MNNPEEVIDYLNTLAQQQHLIERASEICDEQIISQGGSFNDCKLENLQKRFRSHCLVFKSGLVPYTFIKTHFDLYTLDNKYIGYFSLVTNIDGTLVDTISAFK